MSTTANRAYPYPVLTDDFDPPGDFQALANAVDADVEALASPPICHCVQQAAQTGWTSATPTAVTFGTSSTVLDTDAIHSESSNNSRFVIGKKLGWWEVSGVYCPPSNTNTTLMRAIIFKNGVLVAGSFGGHTSSGTANLGECTPEIMVEATASGDYVELMGYQTAASGTIGTAGINTYVASSIKLEWKRPSA